MQVHRKGLRARFSIQDKAQSHCNLAQVVQIISHWKTDSDESALDSSVSHPALYNYNI